VNDDEAKLENALRLAAADPAARPAFYDLLMDSKVYVLTQGTDLPRDVTITLPENTLLAVHQFPRKDGSLYVPFFSSIAELQRSIREEASYVRFSTSELFKMTRGQTLILNPHSDLAKEFVPSEIEALLAGKAPGHGQRVIKEATQILLGQPAVYPLDFVEALKKHFAKRPAVEAAYLALIHDPSQDPEPNLLVGVKTDANVVFEVLFREIGAIAVEYVKDRPVDFVRIGKGNPSDYLVKETTPFYHRVSWRSDPKLAGRLHVDFPDDLQVVVHEGGPRFTEKRPEAAWVRITGQEGDVFTGQILNQLEQLSTLGAGSVIKFVVSSPALYPVQVRDKYLQERGDWIIKPCSKCGFAELFDAPSDLMRKVFPNLPDDAVMQTFTAFCGLCGGVQVVQHKSAGEEFVQGDKPAKPWWRFW